MELFEFASLVLHTPDVATKLTIPDHLTDARPPRDLSLPREPARPRRLGLPPLGQRVRSPLPSLKALEKDGERAKLLHFFANHELLALELMALLLLKFPDAPAKFRRGIAGTMMDEQRHLKLYVDRMEELGLAFGEVPVNRYFWDLISPLPSPLTFVVQMSLTLEQANLDFAFEYWQIFQKLGDSRTSAIMARIYEDEITHVRHGVDWFHQWRPGNASDWEEYKTLLPWPLTPARAKGLSFHAEARQKAGLSPTFIDELRVYQHSKGRPPRIFWFNPEFEEEIASFGKGYVAPKALKIVKEDLGPLMMFLARPDDVVMVSERPRAAHLRQLMDAGFAPCQLVDQETELRGRLVQGMEPWGRTPSTQKKAAQWGVSWASPPLAPVPPHLGSKVWAKTLAQKLWGDETPGMICHDLEGALAEVTRLATMGQTALLKAPWGTAGRGHRRLPCQGINGSFESQPSPQDLSWLRQVISRQGSVVIEPLFERVADFSVQIQVADGGPPVLGVTRFLTSAQGQYKGHVLGQKLDGLTPEEVRAFHQLDIPGVLKRTGAKVAEALAEEGYRGPAGIDAFLYRDGPRLRLYPLVEINGRYTMGRVALALDQRVHPSARALWVHLTKSEVQRRGFTGFAELAEHWSRERPLTFKNQGLTSGIVWTTDPWRAQQIVTVLLVGEEALRLTQAAAP